MHLPKRNRLSPEQYTEGILSGNRMVLGKAITLVESRLPADAELAHAVMEQVLPHSGNSVRIGITGVPGVGKSTFIEVLGGHLTGQGKKLAVLAVDPSSQRTKGSIMGDKTRMEELARDPNAFIRPSPSGDTLGGVTRKTRETILLCEAAGYEVIFVETVGVGQSETAVSQMTDFFLLLMLAGAGDELQGIKKGIMEMAHAIAITKADGDNIGKSTSAQAEYRGALHLFPPAANGWFPEVVTCSALTGQGISELWDMIGRYEAATRKSGWWQQNRSEQNLHWMHERIRQNLLEQFYGNELVASRLEQLQQQVKEGVVPAPVAAEELLKLYGSASRNA
jgi:LAO/AO transport system kinase